MSTFAFVILGVLGIALIAVVLKSLSSIGPIRMGHAKLDCPYCGKQTAANRPVCEHCGSELR